MEARSYASTPLKTSKMPPGIPYIIGNEAAERFSFYGMRTILTIFMVNYLWLMGDTATEQLSDSEAIEKYHFFTAWVYFTPLLGALLADILFGKYRVIMVLSLVYCIGHLALALMGIVGPAPLWLNIGLWLIILGSGGIKGCVTAHVGDQFGKENRHLLAKVFNWFYWSINLGAFVSSLLTPWLLEWYGPHLAFGVPGILMGLATLFFWMGRWKFAHIPSKGLHFFKELLSGEGIRAVLKLLLIYAFVAMFWALFDQTGSSWVLQAEDMDRNWLGFEWLPSQIQAWNPVLILILIPIFSYGLYPIVDKFFHLTPIRKISIGFFLTTLSFVVIAMAQEQIDAGATPSVAWQAAAYILLTSGEVMVSTVCLEFSYTQAPRTMKSLIMGVFFLSVFFGNHLTSTINHFIQVPSPTAKITSTTNEVVHGGFDQQTGTSDDIKITFNDEGKRTSLAFAGKAELDTLLDTVIAAIEEKNFTALSDEEGESLTKEVKDPWGHEYQYKLINKNRIRIWSNGADEEKLTPWDQGATLVISRAEGPKSASFFSFLDTLRPEKPWLEKRKEELGLETQEETLALGPSISRNYFVGGLIKLEGASYFWFFTFVMLGSAVLFVFVAKFYKPKEYFHDDEDHAEAQEEAIGN
ncbi:MAG: MFS transporter [Verrucomicrobiales bacterium]|nr:MFS transporter [Verrucomicrobiales bacterium]